MEEHLTPAVHEAARADLIYENSFSSRASRLRKKNKKPALK
jgi:hypothetical protein